MTSRPWPTRRLSDFEPVECEPGPRTSLREGVNIGVNMGVNIGVNFPVMFPVIFPAMFPMPAQVGCEVARWRAAQV